MSSRSTSVLSSSTADGFLHGDVARDSFQFSYLVIAVGGLKGELPMASVTVKSRRWQFSAENST